MISLYNSTLFSNLPKPCPSPALTITFFENFRPSRGTKFLSKSQRVEYSGRSGVINVARPVLTFSR